MKKLIPVLVVLFFSCNGQKNAENEQPKADSIKSMDTLATAPKSAEITAAMLDFPNDPVCGMPVKKDIADTVVYKGKVYGFCATECKADFLKDPESFLTTK